MSAMRLKTNRALHDRIMNIMSAILNKITKGFIILVIACMPVLFCTSAIHYAVAEDLKIDSGYSSELIGDNKWGKEVISKSEGYGDDSKTVVSGVNDFLFKVGTALIIIACIASVARLAGRGIIDMTSDSDESDQTWAGIPGFFKSGQERKTKTASGRSPTWAREMLIETGIFFLIAIAAGTIIVLLLGIYNFVMSAILEKAPGGLSQFNAPGGISVNTTAPAVPSGTK